MTGEVLNSQIIVSGTRRPWGNDLRVADYRYSHSPNQMTGHIT